VGRPADHQWPGRRGAGAHAVPAGGRSWPGSCGRWTARSTSTRWRWAGPARPSRSASPTHAAGPQLSGWTPPTSGDALRGLEGATAQAWPTHGRIPAPPGRLLRVHCRDRGFWRRLNPPVGGLDMSPPPPGKAWSTRGTPIAHCDSTSAARTTTMRPARPQCSAPGGVLSVPGG
jgi:hypothetical protein